jgi:hypothetical protein
LDQHRLTSLFCLFGGFKVDFYAALLPQIGSIITFIPLIHITFWLPTESSKWRCCHQHFTRWRSRKRRQKKKQGNQTFTTQEMRRQRACCPPKEVVDMTAQQAQPQALEEEDDYMSAAFIVDAAPPATSSQAPKRKRGTLASLFITLFIYLFPTICSIGRGPAREEASQSA